MSLTTEVSYKPYIELSVIFYFVHIICLIKAVRLKENKILLIISFITSIYNLLLVLIILYAVLISFNY
ncbi:hypothetical protein AHA02nite_17360 [Alkalibacillus haloalkaliphilus]|uniref:Uncharacterized protein n=1 Tax=Alkalibacillus haloalkaliphilus TaxID=94136 RepID=A0A511W4F5_9BACI|nr:hypothetical protein AHA02nite_17360 [Alkalibacillus haloalkaliphilus]